MTRLFSPVAPVRDWIRVAFILIALAIVAVPAAHASFSQINETLAASNAADPGQRGSSIALSRDGVRMIVGAPQDDTNLGAAWVYRLDNGAWVEEAKLVPVNAVGNPRFGNSVSLSIDGTYAAIGGPKDDSNGGAAWIFQRSGITWTFVQKLIGSGVIGNGAEQGTSVSLSDCGDYACFVAVGGQYDGLDNIGGLATGAIWLWNRENDGTWVEQNKLVGDDLIGNSQQGYSVSAVALNGSQRIAVGGPNDNGGQGAIWIFHCNGLSSCGTNHKVTATGGGGSGVGYSVALSQQGDRLVAGGPYDFTNVGAIWVFSYAGGSWVQDGSKLIATSGNPVSFGLSVATSSDGLTVLAGSPGASSGEGGTWMFVRRDGTWVDVGGRIQATVDGFNAGGAQGVAVALSGDANLLAIGASSYEAFTGTAFTFYQLPEITSLDPAQGVPGGGTSVTINGRGFSGIAANSAVTFGGTNVQSVAVQDPTRLLVTTPVHAAGIVDVVVANSADSVTASGGFTYLPPAPVVTSVSPNTGPTAGGTHVVITGTNFTGVNDVEFGIHNATSFTFVSDTKINAVTPPGTHGAAFIRVAATGGAHNSSVSFNYLPKPAVSGLSKTSALVAGGGSITISGGGFVDITSVKFGTTEVASFNVVNESTIKTTIPAHAAGAINVVVSGSGGASQAGTANKFTYFAKPAITSVNPNTGPVTGGTLVSIVGSNLSGATSVKFGTKAATSFSVSSATTATATAPAGVSGSVNVTITTPGGTSTAGTVNRYTYTRAPAFKLIAKFVGGKNDGYQPQGTLVADSDGVLYGTTKFGGKADKGTIFRLTPGATSSAAWKKEIIHHFDGARGATPQSGLEIDAAGNLYGTTYAGGTKNAGVAFKLVASSLSLQILHYFENGDDGAFPIAGLVRNAATGDVFGVTSAGGSGSKNFGVIFKIKAPNLFYKLGEFSGTNGDYVLGSPILDKNGVLYGAGSEGGPDGSQRGVIFKITPAKVLSRLYAFKTGTDAQNPRGALFMPNKDGSLLFGTAAKGGAQNKGAVFEFIAPSTEKVLYSFTGASGSAPYGAVTGDAKGALYGTTVTGGANNNGVVYRLLPPPAGQTAWTQSVLYSFKGDATDGAKPRGGLLLGKNNTLFGTTSAGGSTACLAGCGTVFRVAY